MHQVLFEPLYVDTQIPVRATELSAGYDVFAHIEGRTLTTYCGAIESSTFPVNGVVWLGAGCRMKIPLGFKARMPEYLEAQLRPRSGLALRQGLTLANAPGTVDADYPDEWAAIVRHCGMGSPIGIRHGDRIAQLVFNRFEVVEFVRGNVAMSTRRAGGFGHTGV